MAPVAPTERAPVAEAPVAASDTSGCQWHQWLPVAPTERAPVAEAPSTAPGSLLQEAENRVCFFVRVFLIKSLRCESLLEQRAVASTLSRLRLPGLSSLVCWVATRQPRPQLFDVLGCQARPCLLATTPSVPAASAALHLLDLLLALHAARLWSLVALCSKQASTRPCLGFTGRA